MDIEKKKLIFFYLIAFVLIGCIFAGIITLFVFDQQSTGGIDILQVIFNVKGF